MFAVQQKIGQRTLGFLGILFGVLYSIVLCSCASLIFRFFLQSYCIWVIYFFFLYGTSWFAIQKRLNSDTDPTQKARIKKLKTIPKVPTPPLRQKTFCWVELLDDDEADHSDCTLVATSGSVDQALDLAEKDTEDKEESTEEIIQDIKAWSLKHPCVIVSSHNEGIMENFGLDKSMKVGGILTVHLQHGDPTKPYFHPYQLFLKTRLMWWALQSLFRCFVGIFILWTVFGGLPICFASSQALEDAINGFWDSTLNSIVEYLVEKYPSLADDDADPDADDVYDDCHIPPHVALSYDLLILSQVLIMVAMPTILYAKTKKLYGMEEPPADSYQLLRGDEDEDELNDRTEDVNERDAADKPESEGGNVCIATLT